jgi:3',5'-cyclic AMP phosphodiesterase CpdA
MQNGDEEARMKRIVWITDIHLGMCDGPAVERFHSEVKAAKPDAVLLGGDIDEAPGLTSCLRAIAARLEVPIYFVLGNHDYYGGSLADVRDRVAALARNEELLHWLPVAGVVTLAPRVGLVGHSGWADGRLGDYRGSDVMLNDYLLIDDFVGLDSPERLALLHRLGDEAAAHLRSVLSTALERYDCVIALTHVPPFLEATRHEGRVSDRYHLPHFACKATGEVFLDLMQARPDRELLVLCGHTHSPASFRPLDNLCVLAGHAHYGRPHVQRVFDLFENFGNIY